MSNLQHMASHSSQCPIQVHSHFLLEHIYTIFSYSLCVSLLYLFVFQCYLNSYLLHLAQQEGLNSFGNTTTCLCGCWINRLSAVLHSQLKCWYTICTSLVGRLFVFSNHISRSCELIPFNALLLKHVKYFLHLGSRPWDINNKAA